MDKSCLTSKLQTRSKFFHLLRTFFYEVFNHMFAFRLTQLKENAVLTIFPHYPPHLQPQNKRFTNSQDHVKQQLLLFVSKSLQCNSDKAMEVAEPFSKEVAVQVNEDSKIMDLFNSNKQKKVHALQRRLQQKSMAIRNMRKQYHCLNTRISSMKSLIEELKSKNLIDSEYALQLENMTGIHLHKELLLLGSKKRKNLFTYYKSIHFDT